METRIRFDEVRRGDIILWHGAKERVTEVFHFPAPANEYYPDEITVRFDLEPADKEAVELLRGYSKGSYGGVGCLYTTLISRPHTIYYVKCYDNELNETFVKNDYSTKEEAEKALVYYTEKDSNFSHFYYIDDKYED